MIFSKISYARKISLIPEELMPLYVHSTHPGTHTQNVYPLGLYRELSDAKEKQRDAHNPCATQMPHRITFNIGQFSAVVRQEPPCFLSLQFSLWSFTQAKAVQRCVFSPCTSTCFQFFIFAHISCRPPAKWVESTGSNQ